MTTVTASSLGSLLNSAEFKPYVYGATTGKPSKGRPEKVLANPDLPVPAVRRLEAAREEPTVQRGAARRAREAARAGGAS